MLRPSQEAGLGEEAQVPAVFVNHRNLKERDDV